MVQKLRVAVIGVGYLGKLHARIYARLPDVDLVGVIDINPAVAETVSKECGCPGYTKVAAVLDRVQAVSIVVPTSAHREMAEPFLDRGVHMLMEKPIAPTYEESVRLVEQAERAGIIFQVGHLERFNAGVRTLSRLVVDPRFIEAHRMSPFVARATDVDVVTDLMIHDIDLVLSLVPSSVAHVAAAGTPVLTRHIDIANARLQFANGAVANLTASRVSDKRFRRIRIFERQRYQALNFIDQQIETVEAKPVANALWPEIVRTQVHVEPWQPLDKELEAFVESVRLGKPPLVDGRVALNAVEVAMQVRDQMAAWAVPG